MLVTRFSTPNWLLTRTATVYRFISFTHLHDNIIHAAARREHGQDEFVLIDSAIDDIRAVAAERVLKRLVDTGTPHQYWLARGFIALSDVYARRGDKFQAREYLLSLKENYPGTENDIFEMINVRLNELGSSNAK